MFAWFRRRGRGAKICIGLAVVWGVIVMTGTIEMVVEEVGDDNADHDWIGTSYGNEEREVREKDDWDDDLRTCIRAAHSAHEWRAQVKSYLDRPETYDDDLRWKDVSVSMMKTEDDRLLVAVLRESRVSDYEGGSDARRVQVVGYNFTTENLYGNTIYLRAIGAFSPAPECRLLEMVLLDGWF